MVHAHFVGFTWQSTHAFDEHTKCVRGIDVRNPLEQNKSVSVTERIKKPSLFSLCTRFFDFQQKAGLNYYESLVYDHVSNL